MRSFPAKQPKLLALLFVLMDTNSEQGASHQGRGARTDRRSFITGIAGTAAATLFTPMLVT